MVLTSELWCVKEMGEYVCIYLILNNYWLDLRLLAFICRLQLPTSGYWVLTFERDLVKSIGIDVVYESADVRRSS